MGAAGDDTVGDEADLVADRAEDDPGAEGASRLVERLLELLADLLRDEDELPQNRFRDRLFRLSYNDLTS
jgi:hypothetical protein